jgi:hypothetical protein
MRVTNPIDLSTVVRGLSYLPLASLALVVHPLFLRLPWSYFLNALPKRHMMCVHFLSVLCSTVLRTPQV